jgi:hypothetical protein
VPMPQAPAGTIYPRPSAVASEAEGTAVPAAEQAEPLLDEEFGPLQQSEPLSPSEAPATPEVSPQPQADQEPADDHEGHEGR